MINTTRSTLHHPSAQLLFDHEKGELPLGFTIAIATHLEYCAECRSAAEKNTRDVSATWFAETSEIDVASVDFEAMIEDIVNQPKPTSVKEDSPTQLDGSRQLRDRTVQLPPVLSKIVNEELAWKTLANGIHQSLLPLDEKTKCEIIYMEPGSRVPNHTHMGREHMVVLDGELSDQLGRYSVGDFVCRDESDQHGQKSESGCICLFVTDAPLKFTEGLPRLLNPINTIRHWWSVTRS